MEGLVPQKVMSTKKKLICGCIMCCMLWTFIFIYLDDSILTNVWSNTEELALSDTKTTATVKVLTVEIEETETVEKVAILIDTDEHIEHQNTESDILLADSETRIHNDTSDEIVQYTTKRESLLASTELPILNNTADYISQFTTENESIMTNTEIPILNDTANDIAQLNSETGDILPETETPLLNDTSEEITQSATRIENLLPDTEDPMHNEIFNDIAQYVNESENLPTESEKNKINATADTVAQYNAESDDLLPDIDEDIADQYTESDELLPDTNDNIADQYTESDDLLPDTNDNTSIADQYTESDDLLPDTNDNIADQYTESDDLLPDTNDNIADQYTESDDLLPDTNDNIADQYTESDDLLPVIDEDIADQYTESDDLLPDTNDNTSIADQYTESDDLLPDTNDNTSIADQYTESDDLLPDTNDNTSIADQYTESKQGNNIQAVENEDISLDRIDTKSLAVVDTPISKLTEDKIAQHNTEINSVDQYNHKDETMPFKDELQVKINQPTIENVPAKVNVKTAQVNFKTDQVKVKTDQVKVKIDQVKTKPGTKNVGHGGTSNKNGLLRHSGDDDKGHLMSANTRAKLVKERCKTFKKENPNYVYTASHPYDDHSYMISKRYKLLICYNSKVASTNQKRLLYALDKKYKKNINNIGQKSARDYANGRYATFDKVKAKTQNYYKAMLVREPLERLLSAYRDSRGYKDNFQKSNFKFKDFLQLILKEDITTLNRHHFPYYERCRPCEINYDNVGLQNNFNKDMNVMMKSIHAKGIDNTPSRKETGYSSVSTDTLLKKYYSDVPHWVIHKLWEMFYKDYYIFGFPYPKHLMF